MLEAHAVRRAASREDATVGINRAVNPPQQSRHATKQTAKTTNVFLERLFRGESTCGAPDAEGMSIVRPQPEHKPLWPAY